MSIGMGLFWAVVAYVVGSIAIVALAIYLAVWILRKVRKMFDEINKEV